jgi:hypothetical protein
VVHDQFSSSSHDLIQLFLAGCVAPQQVAIYVLPVLCALQSLTILPEVGAAQPNVDALCKPGSVLKPTAGLGQFLCVWVDPCVLPKLPADATACTLSEGVPGSSEYPENEVVADSPLLLLL